MKQGEIYLVRFPFTDLTSSKLRPAMVISNGTYNNFENLMFIGIFGNKGNDSYSLELSDNHLSDGKLNKQSFFRFQNIFSLHKTLIVQKVGSVDNDYIKQISHKLHSFTAVE